MASDQPKLFQPQTHQKFYPTYVKYGACLFPTQVNHQLVHHFINFITLGYKIEIDIRTNEDTDLMRFGASSAASGSSR